jgi:hypothetical protein
MSVKSTRDDNTSTQTTRIHIYTAFTSSDEADIIIYHFIIIIYYNYWLINNYNILQLALFIYKPTPAVARFRIRITINIDRMFSEYPALPVVSPHSATL